MFLGGVGRLMLAAVIGVAVVSVMTPSLGHTVSFGITADEVRRHGLLANDPNDPNDPNANSEETHQDQSSAAGDAWQGVSRGIRLD